MVNYNKSIEDVFDFVSCLNDNDRIVIYDEFSGEQMEGPVLDVLDASISLNDEFDNKCNFKIVE